MHEVTAMSKVATLQYKKQPIYVFIREKLGKHGAPYIVIKLPDRTEAHIALKDGKIFDSTITRMDIINFVKEWIGAYFDELMASWEAAKKGKALAVPSDMPKAVESEFKVRKVQEVKVGTKPLTLVLTFETGETRLVDFAKDVIPQNSAFHCLSDPNIFKEAKADGSAVVWESADIDIEAADLYEVSTEYAPHSTKIASHYSSLRK